LLDLKEEQTKKLKGTNQEVYILDLVLYWILFYYLASLC